MEPQQTTYSQAIARLEQIAQRMNEETSDIDAVVASALEAAELIKSCRRRLRSAEEEIEAAWSDIETGP